MLLNEIEALPHRDYMPHESARYMPLLIRAVRQLGAVRLHAEQTLEALFDDEEIRYPNLEQALDAIDSEVLELIGGEE